MAKKKIKSKSSGYGWPGRIAAILALLGSLTIMPTTILFVVGMIPTFVAFFVDRDPRKRSGYSIGALNFAATLAFLIRLWVEGNAMNTTMQLLVNPTTLMIIYASAWVGWLIHSLIPPFISDFVKKNAEKRISRILKHQKKIIEEWGEAVTGEQIQQHRVMKSKEQIDAEQAMRS